MSFMRSYETLKYWLELSFLWISSSSVGAAAGPVALPELTGALVPIVDDDGEELAEDDEPPADGTSRCTSGTR